MGIGDNAARKTQPGNVRSRGEDTDRHRLQFPFWIAAIVLLDDKPKLATGDVNVSCATLMKAVVTQGYGSPDVLVFRDIDAPPAPKGRQVLVRVRACGVCRRDILVRQGPQPPRFGRPAGAGS